MCTARAGRDGSKVRLLGCYSELRTGLTLMSLTAAVLSTTGDMAENTNEPRIGLSDGPCGR